MVIDDRRVFKHDRDPDFEGEVVYARNSRQGLIELVQNGPWNVVYLDHDLGGDDEIRQLVKYLAAHADAFGPENRYVHTVFYSCSSNPWGRDWTVDTLRHAGFTAHAKQPACSLHRFRGEW